MISTGEVVVERVAVVEGHGESLEDLAVESSRVVLGSFRVGLGSSSVSADSKTLTCPNPTLTDPAPISAVVAATFSNPNRFPSLAVKVASALGLPSFIPAFDIQMACSAYPYALYVAGKLAQDTGGKVLVLDGDVQSPFVDKDDHATGTIFSDACTASIVSCGGKTAARSYFDFLSRADNALTCPGAGPISMDGFAVFSFVATEVSKFLSSFLDGVAANAGFDPRALPFAPHQANPYMVRRLADELGLADSLITIPEDVKNPGSCSVPMALAVKGRPGRVVVAGFGAGYSASAAVIRLGDDFAM